MQIFIRQSFTAVPFLLGLFIFVGLTEVNAQNNQTIYGVTTGNQLVQFNAATPGNLTTVGAVTGLQAGENILGIDFRPSNGQLFGLGSTSRLYVINRMTGAATAVGSQFPALLSGANFGFDFNPTVDRIRIVSDTGQNLRLNPNTGAVTVDGNLNPGTPAVSAAAYTNSFGVATTTTLYDIDATTDQLLIQSNPNAGTLTVVGPLGVDFQAVNGFDIASNNAGGTAVTTNVAYAVSASGLGNPQLYTINLTTGAATSAGSIGGITNLTPLRGIAVTASAASAAVNLIDTDGNRRADYIVARASDNVNTILAQRPDGSIASTVFGFADDVLTPGDYDGDGRTDLAVWRPSNGTFYVLRSSDSTLSGFQFGLNGDEPVARDYDGDGRTDYAVVRRSNGILSWYIQNSLTNTFRAVQFGAATDIVAPGDYDGDRNFDLAVYRGSANNPATFYVQRSTAGFIAQQFGLASDQVVPGDYDGDGRTDYAVLRNSSSGYNWYILRSSNNSFQATILGIKPHLSVQNDYDGDGRTDIAVWNPLNGAFYVIQSVNGATAITTFGQNGDYPVANYDTH